MNNETLVLALPDIQLVNPHFNTIPTTNETITPCPHSLGEARSVLQNAFNSMNAEHGSHSITITEQELRSALHTAGNAKKHTLAGSWRETHILEWPDRSAVIWTQSLVKTQPKNTMRKMSPLVWKTQKGHRFKLTPLLNTLILAWPSWQWRGTNLNLEPDKDKPLAIPCGALDTKPHEFALKNTAQTLLGKINAWAKTKQIGEIVQLHIVLNTQTLSARHILEKGSIRFEAQGHGHIKTLLERFAWWFVKEMTHNNPHAFAGWRWDKNDPWAPPKSTTLTQNATPETPRTQHDFMLWAKEAGQI